MVRKPKHLLVFSSVRHTLQNGRMIAHGGFVREIDTWARVFDRVTVAAVSAECAKADCIPYTQSNIEIEILDKSLVTDGHRKIHLFWKYPRWLIAATKLITSDTVIMARGPDYLGFIGFLITRFNRIPRLAKYADQWSPYSGEPLAYRFQRFVYRSGFFGGPVIANAARDPQRPFVIPIYNASLSLAEWTDAGIRIENRNWPKSKQRRLLYVGQLGATKGVDVLLHALNKIVKSGLNVGLDIVGDGPSRTELEALTENLALTNCVRFHGWRSRGDVFDFAAKAYCLVNCSYRQGLDKVVLEGMAHALPIIGTTTSVMPDLIEPPTCGLLTNPGNIDALATALTSILTDVELAQTMGTNARQKVKITLIDDMQNKYRDLLRAHLHMNT